jgi:hypothetical protein
MTVPLRPAVLAGNWTLLATYPESNARSKHLDGGCLPAQLTPGSGIRIVWQPGLRYSTRDGVALAYLKGGQLESISTWRYGQALAGPRLGHGATPAGGTPWSEWRLEGVLNSRGTELILLGLQVTIDTSAAGFTAVPCYFAWLPRSLWDPAQVAPLLYWLSEEGLRANPNLAWKAKFGLFQLLATAFGHIYAPAAESFTFRLWLPWLRLLEEQEGSAPLKIDQLQTYAQQFSVCWLGIQGYG